MPRISVDSAVMDFVDYRHHMLDIYFDSGHVYRYFDVSPKVYEGLLNADSKGLYFHHHIRGHYRFQRLS